MKREGNAVIPVPMVKDSDMYNFYKKEAEQRGVGLPTHVYQLLMERYEAMQHGKVWSWYPMQINTNGEQQQSAHPPVAAEDNSIKTSPNTTLQVFGSEDD